MGERRSTSWRSRTATSRTSRSTLEAAMTIDDATLFLPIRDLAQRIRKKEVSPVALAELSLARLDKVGAQAHAVVRTLRDRALTAARPDARRLARGPDRGV